MENSDAIVYDPHIEDDFSDAYDNSEEEIVDEEDEPFYRSLDDY